MKYDAKDGQRDEPSPRRPMLVYDGDCGFCRRWVARWQEETGGAVDYQEFQKVGDSFPGIPRAAFESAVQLIEPDGCVTSGADAVFRLFDFAPRKPWLLRLLPHLPGGMPIARAAYRFIAAHRGLASSLTHLLWSSTFSKPG